MTSFTHRHTNIGPYLAAILLVIMGVWRIPAPETRLGFTLLVEYSIVIALAYLIARTNVWWGFFILIIQFSSFYPVYSRFTFLSYYGVVMAGFWFFLINHWFNRLTARHLMDAMCVIACIHVSFQILQFFNLDPLFIHRNPEAQQCVGVMANRNEVSSLLAISMPAFLRPRWIWGLIPVALGLILAKTMGGVVAVAGGILFYNIMHGRLYISLALAILAVVVYAWLVDGPTLHRLAVWKIGLKTWSQHWLFGSGIGHWKIVFKEPMVNNARWATAHNEFIQGLFEMGIPFVIVIIGYIVNIIRRYRSTALIPTTALVVIALNSCVHFPFHIAVTALMAVTWLALLEIDLREPQPGPPAGGLPDIAI